MNPNYSEINLKSYEGVESLSTFQSREKMEEYRNKKILSCQKAVNLISKLVTKKAKVFEIGSGNSKLLYALSMKNLLVLGYGVEISRSRFEFAELWKNDLRISNVTNINEDILKLDLTQFKNMDLFVCVDITFQFFNPIEKDADKQVLDQIYSSLAYGGYLILELWSMKNILKGIHLNHGHYKTWEEFDLTDPFIYSLHHYRLDKEGSILLMKSFLPRDFDLKKKSVMTNVLKPYSTTEIVNLIKSAGFSEVNVYSDFDRNPYTEEKDEYIVIARKV